MSNLDELYGRLALADGIITMLSNEDDPRAPEAKAHYEGQRAELVRKIQACNPPPVVVQANVAQLGAHKAT